MPTVEDSVLDDFKSAFDAFSEAEEKRLKRDKEFLEGLNVSDLPTAVSTPVDKAVQLAESELTELTVGV